MSEGQSGHRDLFAECLFLTQIGLCAAIVQSCFSSQKYSARGVF